MGTRQPKPRYDGVKVVRDMAAKGWETKDLAAATGKSHMTIRRFLQGEVQTTKTATAIAGALGFEPGRYLAGVTTTEAA